MSDRLDGAAARPHRLGERRLATGALLGLVIAAVLLRLVPVIFEPSLNWGDEIFQAMEPAHRLVYGYGLVAWEFQLGMRSWLLPGMIAGLMELSRVAGDGPAYYLPAVAIGFGLLASAPVVCCFLWCYRWFGLAGAAVAGLAVTLAPELVYFGARTSSEVVAAHLLVVAFYLTEPGYKVTSRRRFVAAGILFGLVCLLRIQIAPAVAVVALWPARHDWRSRLPALAGGFLAALAFGATLDWLTLGYPLASIWRNFYYNLYLGISSDFDINPWYYYLLGELGIWLSAAPLVAVLAVLGARRLPILATAALVVVAVHSAIGHKEYRFIYPAIVPLMILAAIGLGELASWGEERLRQHGWRGSLARATGIILPSAVWVAIAASVWSGGVIAPLRQRDRDELLAMTFVRQLPSLCGIAIDWSEAWVWAGGYSHLHRRIPMYWPTEAGASLPDASAFNVLIYRSVPPKQSGFDKLRCFGAVCVAQRPGPCEARAMPAMWFPPQLRAIAPAAERFEALPPRSPPDRVRSQP